MYQQGWLWLGSSSDCQDLNLRQVQDERHGVEQPQPLLFKPLSSTQLIQGVHFKRSELVKENVLRPFSPTG